jgi:putative ABC transport system permease protein
MTLWTLVKRSLLFYWRTNLGVLLAVLVSTAVLTGALVVGDCVRYSLMMMVDARLGKTQLAVVPQDRFFRAALAEELTGQLNARLAPVLHVRGLIEAGDDSKRVNRIEVLGVDRRFFGIGPGGNPFGDDWNQGIVLNEPLANMLGVRPGDEVLLRVRKPGLMSRDIPLTPDSDLSVAFRLDVKALAGRSDFGLFGLQANQVAPLNVFVPLEWLQEKLDRKGRANMFLVAAGPGAGLTVERANQAVRENWQLTDAALELRPLDKQDAFELRSSRVFLDESVSGAAMTAGDGAVPILTYFVNEMRLAGKATPYSFVTAIGPAPGPAAIVPPDMKDDDILINRWLVDPNDPNRAGDPDDPAAEIGKSVQLSYYVVGPTRKLQTDQAEFRVRGILPMVPPAADPNFMPDLPGLADVDNCREWKPGITIDLDKITTLDEKYWNRYRGTPKAFVNLKAGQKMWANVYGNLTAVRYPQTGNSQEQIAARLLSSVNPGSVGLFFQSVRDTGLRAGRGSTDFGQLFLGLSMFLIMASLILTALLFVFGVEHVGMLMAVGFSPRLVRRMLFIEGGVLAVLGAAAGTIVGLLYTRAMIHGLGTVWGSAVAGSTVYFHARPATLLGGALAAVIVSLIAIRLTLRRQTSRPARELLAGGLQSVLFSRPASKGRISFIVAFAAVAAAVLLIVFAGSGDSASTAGVFFGAGALLLVGTLTFCGGLLKILGAGSARPMTSLAGFGLRNSTRRSGRSLAVVALLACGVFLVIAVAANRHNPLAAAHKRDSGTGGFALFGESAMGILHDLNTAEGRESAGLDEGVLNDGRIVQLRVHDGDDASCFNLNRAQSPRLLGVAPGQLQSRGAFKFSRTIKGTAPKDAWSLLKRDLGPHVVPAVGDYPTIVWALGKSLGDEIEYVDHKGRTFRVRIVGMLKNSILQGTLIISEDQFTRRFPSEEGYRLVLVDASAGELEQLTKSLSAAFKDFGLVLTPAEQRLAAFSAVENTYLSIFQMLGGLGLILGSLGLGLVVLRNMLDRRGELAMLKAVGFPKAALVRMVLYEHWGLLLAGLGCGVVAAMVAVGPALRSPGAEIPVLSLTLTVAAIAASGLVWTTLATIFALSGRMLAALRSE